MRRQQQGHCLQVNRATPAPFVKGCGVVTIRCVCWGGCREREEVRGSRGTGNNEEESLIHFLGLAFGL